MLNDISLDEYEQVIEEDYEEWWYEQDISILSKQSLQLEGDEDEEWES